MKDEAVDPIIREFIRSQKDVKIDRYSSKGGFGELYFGVREIFDDRVALKFYELSEGHSEPILLKQITHKNILPIIDAKILNNQYAYYLTPEISGGDLQDIISKYDLSTEYCICIIQSVLKALIELHKPPINLVHRDLKTNNILVDDKEDTPYLADFGTIKKIPDGVTYVSASKYSFLYRAPEVVSWDQYGKQSDIYQIGIVLYQALGGHFPLDSPEEWLNDRASIKYNQLGNYEKQVYLRNYLEGCIVNNKLLKYDTLPNFVSKKLKNIIKTATNKDLTKRFATCADFLKALYNYSQIGINWYQKDNFIFGKNTKKGKIYRIYRDKKVYVSEYSKDGEKWRKFFVDPLIQNHIDKIELI